MFSQVSPPPPPDTWDMGYGILRDAVDKRAVRILLECFFVSFADIVNIKILLKLSHVLRWKESKLVKNTKMWTYLWSIIEQKLNLF